MSYGGGGAPPPPPSPRVPFMLQWSVAVARVQKQFAADFHNQSASTPGYFIKQIRINHHTYQHHVSGISLWCPNGTRSVQKWSVVFGEVTEAVSDISLQLDLASVCFCSKLSLGLISIHLSSSQFISIHKEGSVKNLKNYFLRLNTVNLLLQTIQNISVIKNFL